MLSTENGKVRIDRFLFEQGRVRSREKAKYLIENGLVLFDGEFVKKPSMYLDKNIDCGRLTVNPGKPVDYVGRGAEKLEHAFEKFDLNATGKTAIDVGASTGGFTQVLLQRGVAKVFAVDVGSAQLNRNLLKNSKVVNMERTNFLDLDSDFFNEPVHLITIDVSFVSLRHFAEKLFDTLSSDGDLILLIKPQFEGGRDLVKKGRVKDANRKKNIIENTLSHFTKFRFVNGTDSPIEGKIGKNLEYLVHLKKN